MNLQIPKKGAIAWLAVAMTIACSAANAETVARIWDEQLLHAISQDTARPTVHARNLFHLSAAMYDAWAAFDDTASQYLHHEKINGDEAARNEAISFAAYRVILHRFSTGPAGVGPGRNLTRADLQNQMLSLGYDFNFSSTAGNSPAALGNRIAQTVIDAGLGDGANEVGNYATPPGQFVPVNPPLVFEDPGTIMNDPNHWQPLYFKGNRLDQFGHPILESTQKNLSPFWGAVKPFAMDASDRSANGIYHDQGPQPHLGGAGDADFKSDALTMIRLSAQLDPSDGVMMDISPASRGNSPLGSYTQNGFALNPSTGQPYDQQLVRQADFGRVLAEFWADGPKSTAPPGHWNEIGNYVSDRMAELSIPKRIGGEGPVVSDLEYDVKRYFAMNGGLHDAAIAAWNHKGAYDSARPISFIRYMGGLGQSSDPSLVVDIGGGLTATTYHASGLPLEPGLVEVISAQTTAAGQRHAHLAGFEGKIAVRSWRGAIDGIAPFEDPADISGVDWILAENWMPYQLISFVTPPFAGYVSGHSTFSRTAAEILAQFTGTPFFPGGLGEYDIEAGSGLDFEFGPMEPMSLQWATYFDASDQASISRIFGGIHPPADDLAGRRIGHDVGLAAWAFAQNFYSGHAVPESAGHILFALGIGVMVATKTKRNVRSRDVGQRS